MDRKLAKAIVVTLTLWTGLAAAAPLTTSQRALLQALAENDLKTFLAGGKAQFADDWSAVAVPWTEDKDIGVRYMRGAIAADAFYGRKTIFIKGRYISADNWVADAYRVQLWALAAIVDKRNADFLGAAHNGSAIELACHAQGQEIQFAYVTDCIAPNAAIHALATDEVRAIESLNTKSNAAQLNLVRWLDAVLPKNSSCRTGNEGCEEEITQQMEKAAKDPDSVRRLLRH